METPTNEAIINFSDRKIDHVILNIIIGHMISTQLIV